MNSALKSVLTLTLAVLAVTATASAQTASVQNAQRPEPFAYVKMDQYLKTTDFSPLIEQYSIPLKSERSTGEVIPAAVAEIFARLQMAAFGRTDLIALRTCASCHAEASLEERSIRVEVGFMNRVLGTTQLWEPRSAVAFILAHEIGHFIQEFSGRNKAMLDLNGLPPLFSVRPKNGMTIGDMKPFFEAHAEVDTYGLLIMRKAGYARHTESLQTLMALRTRYWLNQADIDVRLQRITSSLDLLWPR